jgi:hypothetical protein
LGLAADLEPGLLAEAAGARDFLPGRVCGGREAGVVRVARNGRPALDLTLQLTDAAEELMVELMLLA